MIIQVNQARWKQDPGIRDMIAHFDRPERHGRWDLVTKKELEAITEQIRRCQEEFEYAARNYFWITNKEGTDKLFSLWEPQELILDKIRQLRRRNKLQKLMILKARQLGCSTLIEGLIAWRSMFFPNVNAMVVSNVPKHASYLFGIMLHIYDNMPWWLKPMISSRREEDGLKFANPKIDERNSNPGLNSLVMVQAANQVSGVGQGYRLNAVHASEYADWDPISAKEIIDGDMTHALAENVGTFAILESTAKGAGTYAEDLWMANVDLAARAEWYPLFLPWFFEKTRVLAPEAGWRPIEKDILMRERIEKEWITCDACGEFNERFYRGEDRAETQCTHCDTGTMKSYVLGDEQLCWMSDRRINAERRGPESVKELKQELCTTAEEAFQLSGIQVFPQDTQDWVNDTVCDPIAIGNFDEKGFIHAVKDHKTKQCIQEWCKKDHSWDEDTPLRIWEWPIAAAEYVVGVDVAEGLGGKSDYSVAWVNRVSKSGGTDLHVATWRSNIVEPAAFALPCNLIGRMYNEALMSIEYNVYTTVGDLVRIYYQYPNLYRWKHLDSTNPNSNKWHWLTQYNSKAKLWQTAVGRLRQKLWRVQDKNFAFEMRRFQKEEFDSKSASAEKNFHDDTVMAAMIALYTSHDLDWDESSAWQPSVPSSGTLPSNLWIMECMRCRNEWNAATPTEYSACPQCRNIMLRGRPGIDSSLKREVDFQELMGNETPDFFLDINKELV